MPRRRASITALVLALAVVGLAVLAPRPAPAAAAGPVRIMPLGDSITEGIDQHPTYRLALDQRLAADGYDVDMVGSRHGTYPAAFDQDNEGHGGWRAEQLLDGRPGYADQGRLTDWLRATPPDVVLLHIGTNDIRQCESPSSTAEEIRRVITTIRSLQPDADVLVAQIIPGEPHEGRPCTAETAANYADLHARTAALAADLDTARSRVIAVDQASGFVPATDTYDGVHPNAAGAAKMADRWYGPLVALLGATPPTTPPTTSPPPDPGGLPAYWLAASDGRVFTFGSAAWAGDLADALADGHAAVADVEAPPSGAGYWALTTDGVVGAFGAAPFLGDLAGTALLPGESARALASSPTGAGYLVVTTRGRVAGFGDARALGGLLDVGLSQPIVGATMTAGGGGYWLVAADGGVFCFGDAPFRGSAADLPLAAPVVALQHGPAGGYWLVAADGGIFSYDVPFAGSMGGQPMNAPVVGMTRLGAGYLLVGADGGVFNFSDRPFAGSLGGDPPDRPVVALAAAG